MIDILREVGMIERALDSMSNIEFKQIGLARGSTFMLSAFMNTRASSLSNYRT